MIKNHEEIMVSICVVTYNQAEFIRNCLDSILNQKVNFIFEVIVSDDVSTDDTSTILEQYQNQYKGIFRLNRPVQNVGPYENYRIVHGLARGKYIAHCDGDDYWQPGKLQAQVDFLENNLDCSAVYSNALVVDSVTKQQVGVFNDLVDSKFDINYLMARSNFLNHSSMMYHAEMRDEVIPKNKKFIDYMIHANLAGKGFLGYINEPYVIYHINVQGSLVTEQSRSIDKLVIDTVHQAWPKLTQETQEDIRAFYAKKALRSLAKFKMSECTFYYSAINGVNINLHILASLFIEAVMKIKDFIINGRHVNKIFFPRTR